MKTTNLFKTSIILSLTVIFFSACRKRDAALPDNYVVFETAAQGIAAAENTITIKVKVSRGVSADVPVVLNLSEQGIVYGTDYTTVPAPAAGKVSLTIPSGNNEASLTINKVNGALFDGDEKLIVDIFSSASPLLIGSAKQFTLSFGELVSPSSSVTINGGGANYLNRVFIDLSANRQTPVLRTNWDLNFYTGTDDFRVLLNSSLNMMVKQINKTDLNAVTVADTLGFGAEVAFSQTNPLLIQLPFIDYPNGDITKTAIAAISATPTDNKVYIVNRGNGAGSPAPVRGWKKIRILRNAAGGYTLQHADIAAPTFSSIDISKDDAYFFKSVSLENGIVITEPQKKKWDFSWTYFANVANFGSGEVPYMYQDVVLLNRNVQVAKMLTATKPFTDFTEADIAAQTFLTTQNAIAIDWRSGGGPTTSPSVRIDRYYIIKDSDNNYYKIRFTALTQNSERGYPAFESVLIKKG